MALYGISEDDIRFVLERPDEIDVDRSGNPRFTRATGGRVVRVVIAADDPGMVKTVYPRRS